MMPGRMYLQVRMVRCPAVLIDSLRGYGFRCVHSRLTIVRAKLESRYHRVTWVNRGSRGVRVRGTSLPQKDTSSVTNFHFFFRLASPPSLFTALPTLLPTP